MIPKSILGLLSLPLLASAHFHMLYPTPRSDDDDTEDHGPCGGFAVSDNRTQVPLTAFPLALEMGHDRSVVQVLLALGSDPGDNFNITLEQTFQQQGEGAFCLPSVQIPSGVDITDGTNGTLQVVTDGEDGGGLYVCADLTFTSSPSVQMLPSSCTNGTGVTAFPLSTKINANESNADGTPQSGSSGSASSSNSGSSSATASATTGSSTNEAALVSAAWGLLGAAVLGSVALM